MNRQTARNSGGPAATLEALTLESSPGFEDNGGMVTLESL